MNRLNITLIAIIIFLFGVAAGLTISPMSTPHTTRQEYTELIEIVSQSKVDFQKSVLNFYMNSYCEFEDARIVDFMYHGTRFQGVYCDKDTIMLLSDSFPPLPFFILELDFKEENES